MSGAIFETFFRRERPSDELEILAVANSTSHGGLHRMANHLAIIAFIFALTWLAHFSQSRNIGFYSDDQTFAVRPLAWSPEEFRYWLRYKTISYPEPQGRPLGFMLGILFAYLGDRLAGVNGMFIVGWWILSVNAVLFYFLLHRSFTQPIPTLGAIAFVLFPADTTRPFLCHAHILQPSLTFMLMAAHLYLGGSRARRIAAYLVVSLCLITYENALLPFLAIPLLDRARDRRWFRGFAGHIGIVVLIIALVGLTRKLGHEYRAEEVNGSKSTVLLEIVAGSLIGPAAALFAFGFRLWTAIYHLCTSPHDWIEWISATAVFALILRLCKFRDGLDRQNRLAGDVKRAVQFGTCALFVSYLLSFTHFPPACLEGQTTSVHLGAAIGASTLLAAGAGAMMLLKTRRLVPPVVISIYLGLLFSWSVIEQDEYVTLWRERQQFWTRLIDICPDLTDGTLIICDNQLPQPNKLMPLNCWSDSVVLEQTMQFPGSFAQNPQVSCFAADSSNHGWRSWLKRDPAGHVVWDQSPYGRRKGAELIEGKTILLHMDPSARITRAAGTIDIAGKPFRLKDQAPRGLPTYPTLRFYHILADAAR